jgi:hypothetical protein
MAFTAQELNETASELRSEIGRFLSKPTEPDVLLGNHPLSVFASQKQSIAIWHGRRIEDHLADWIGKSPDWSAKARERISIGTDTCEIDNLAWNSRLGLVVAVEAKRVWANQDKASQEDVKRKNKLYTDAANTPLITSHVRQSGAAFRHFVFDVYGKTDKGKNGLLVIAGDKIERVFEPALARYVEWERQVMANALFEKLDHQQAVDSAREGCLKEAVLAGSSQATIARSLQDVLDFIDEQADVR